MKGYHRVIKNNKLKINYYVLMHYKCINPYIIYYKSKMYMEKFIIDILVLKKGNLKCKIITNVMIITNVDKYHYNIFGSFFI